MKKHILISGLLLTAAFAIIWVSCKKEEPDPPAPTATTTAIGENAIAEVVFADVFKQVGQGSKDAESEVAKKSNSDVQTGCPSLLITPFDTGSWPKTIVIDFGTTNCVGTDGASRRGKINCSLTHWYRMPGSVLTITFQDYYVNEYKVEATKTVTNNGLNADSNYVFTLNVQNALITTPLNKQFTWNSTRTHEWIEGEPTVLNPYDDVYLVTGSANGVSSANENYTITITEALNVLVGCRWVRAGKLKINIESLSEIGVDYGDTPACDASATVTYMGATYPITQP
ncbi:MAG: hypothetical protein KKA07_05335 [Bacteroidetes bacterium]|nr:hypothetical protein [Bacteroidota bacterium]MBU1718476.1 hypothetical protein [Bacteroidota bacterium]